MFSKSVFVFFQFSCCVIVFSSPGREKKRPTKQIKCQNLNGIFQLDFQLRVTFHTCIIYLMHEIFWYLYFKNADSVEDEQKKNTTKSYPVHCQFACCISLLSLLVVLYFDRVRCSLENCARTHVRTQNRSHEMFHLDSLSLDSSSITSRENVNDWYKETE